jgi:hypothetical protein
MKTQYYLKTIDGTIIATDSPQYWTECAKLTQKEGQAAYHKQQCAKLRKWLKPGSTVYTVLRYVSSPGMSRRISCLITLKDGSIMDISGYVGDVIGSRRNEKDGSLIVSGCGMDMGFHVVYSLSRRLFPDGFKLPKGKMGRNGDTSGHDKDGGYALNQRWL